MEFAKKQLTKQGWTEGCGLGKTESGIKEPVKVKIKNDTKGVGHDSGADFTFHWWDHLFNKAASNIQVKQTEAGVEIENSKPTERSKKKTKSFDNKKMLYGQFIKGATLNGGDMTVEEVHEEEPIEEETVKHALIPDNEAEIFKKCGGRTAHKGARHGLKLNGKLERIQKQEQLLLDKLCRTSTDENHDKKSGDKTSQSEVTYPFDGSDSSQSKEKLSNSLDKSTCEIKREKKKKKKKRRRDNTDKEQNVENNLDTEVTEEKVQIGKKTKKRKHENTEMNMLDVEMCKGEEEDGVERVKKVKNHPNETEILEKGEHKQNAIENEVNTVVLSQKNSKKKKKSKKNKHQN